MGSFEISFSLLFEVTIVFYSTWFSLLKFVCGSLVRRLCVLIHGLKGVVVKGVTLTHTVSHCPGETCL